MIVRIITYEKEHPFIMRLRQLSAGMLLAIGFRVGVAYRRWRCLSSTILPTTGKGLIGKFFAMAESSSTGVVNIWSKTLNVVVTAGTKNAARVSNWIKFLVGTKLFHGEKSHFRLPAISMRRGYRRETGYCFFPNAEAAADVVAVSFLCSALAWRSIGISGSASFQVAKKSS